jgi:hypothetical protein
MVATGSTPCPHDTAPGSTLADDMAPDNQLTDAGHGNRIPPVVYVLSGVIFLMGTTEYMVAGLLPQISSGLHVSVNPRAGMNTR